MFITLYKTYKLCCVVGFTIIFICSLLGIDVKIKPFKYSFKNLIK